MGAQCVKPSIKQSITSHETKITSKGHQLRHCDQNILFTMTIQHLRLTNMTEQVKQIRFSLKNYFQIIYSLNEFSIQDNLIKSEKIHKTLFQLPAKKINSQIVFIQIIGLNSSIIETVKLKLIYLCTGPVHHDHLMKQLRARLMFNLHLFQNIKIQAKSKDFKITPVEPNFLNMEKLSYKFTLTTQFDEKTFQSNQSFLKNNGYFENLQMSRSVPNNVLKQSNFRFQILSSENSDDRIQETNKVIHSIFIPYRKIQTFQTFTSSKKKEIDFIKKSLSLNEIVKFQDQIIANISFIFEVQTSILYVQQMQCLIMSEIGVSSVSPTVSKERNDENDQEIQQIYKKIKSIKSISTDKRTQIIKILDEIHSTFLISNQVAFTSQQELYEKQMLLVKFLNQLSVLFRQGDDILNEKLWRAINHIAHKPELSTRYLTLHKKLEPKKQVYLHYYKFITNVLSKVIACTEIGITFQELQCIQKFIAFSYFRFPWIQNKIIQALSRKQDPIITEEKLIQYGANAGCKSPSKSFVYDWEDQIYKKIYQDKQFKEITSEIEKTSQKFKGWDRLLFNRQDEDLFYGLFLQIWTEAENTLANYRGKILWEYFPNYGKLLSCFLGQMNNSKISDLSDLFKQCSNKLVLNQKLLNTFVIQLFPKTYLFEISCVLKCLSLLESYFEVLTKQNKKLPHDFNFNFFYTGIKSIFQQNHSYLIVKVLYILYKHYEIFTQEFKKTINTFLLSKIFINLFLHWCSNVRQMFHHLIHHKLIQNKISNPQETQDSIQKGLNCKKRIQKQISEQSLINKKIKFYLRAIKNQGDERKISSQKQIQTHRYSYYEKIRLKLLKKKRKINNQNQTWEDLRESKISQHGKSSCFISRKYSFFSENNDLEFSRLRKMSLVDEQNFPQIDEQYKKYCLISLKEYQEVKRKDKSLCEVNKLAKLVQGDIDC